MMIFNCALLSSVSSEFSFSSLTTRRDACVIINILKANRQPREMRDSTILIINGYVVDIIIGPLKNRSNFIGGHPFCILF